MKDNKLYVFFGVGIEYSLNQLYVYMKDQGYNCVEINHFSCNNMKKALLDLGNNEYIFITSAHVFLDETYPFYKKTPMNLSALEAMDILKPVKSVYYPHDLATLVHEFDEPWLNSIFDIILFPMEGYAHLACHGKPVYNVGWIKKLGKIGSGTRYKVGHGIGDWGYYRNMGFENVYNVFKSIWDQGVVVKNVLKDRKILQVFWEQKKINYIDPTLSIFELIDTCEIILTNALTSVNLESALSGRFTINMLDGIFDKQTHEGYFKGVPNLQLMSISDTAELLKEYYRGEFIPPQGEDVLKPFDFKQAVSLITS